MPAVKVFNIFGGQKPAEKQSPATGIQKFYRTFSVGAEKSPEPKVGKVTAIAAVLEKRISEPKQLSESVTSVISEPVYSKIDINVQSHNYENVVIGTSSPVNNLFGEAKGCSSIYENVSVVGKTPEPTTSLWNLDTMKGKELTSPLKPLAVTPVDKINTDKYATYKITSKAPSRAQCIKTEELKKLDVKTRILKKTLSNPPSTPVPVVSKVKPTPTKTDKKNIEVKKVRAKLFSDHTRIGGESSPRSQMQKSKSVWEIGNEFMSSNLERTKSSTSISGSPSKIPVIRGHMSPNKFSSTRALFSPTPVDLHNIDQARECAQKKKPNTVRKTAEKGDQIKQTKQKSQLHIKTDAKRSTDKSKKEASDKKTVSPKPTFRDYSDEINALRAKFLQKKVNNKRDLALAVSGRQNENDIKIDLPLTPVKCIVKKLEFQNASESKTDSAHYLNCKVIPPEHKELCVANTTFHNHLSTLVGRQISCTQSRNDAILCSQLVKIPLLKQTEEKISDTHSDCSDDSGHVSNDVHDSDVAFDNMHEMSPLPRSVDEVDCKIYRESKQFGNVLSKCPVRPARRGVIGNEAVSGTRTTGDAPKVEDQIMFRGGVVGELDGRRDAALARVLVRLQARARGLLARRRTHKLRTQHTAARCVQRNVRAFLAVRDWPWWRLLVREELDTLKTKLDKVENERALYKDETEKLQTKLSEVGGELAEERSAAAVATERADAEAAERLRIERDNRDLQSNNQRLQQASERLELELLHWRSAENGGLEPSDSEGSESEIGVNGEKYKRRFERAHRELQLVRTQLRRQHEDDLEQLVTVKKQLEKKTCRNNLLEKRQRKFDSELQNAQEELKRERTAKERLSRERDQANAEKYALEQSLSEARLELELKEERLLAASRSLEEREGGDEVSALRRAKNELERRTRDQEEELDELAGQIQLLESSKLRLEMLLEQQRKEARLEAAARDDEMEETRANAAKKLKTEAEASEANAALEEANRAKSEASERAITASREAAAARAQFDDAEEEAAELLKKYRASTNAVCAAQAETRAAEARAEAAAEEARVARERANELSARLAAAEAPHAQTQHENERRLELRNKELESSLELEATSRARLESQVSRLRDAHEQLANELAAARAREHQASDDLRKLTRQIRELKEENASVNVKLSEALRAKSAAESAAASAASEASAARDEARLAARRVAALQEAIAGELSSVQDSRDEDSDNDSYSSDESIGTFLANHKLSSSVPSHSRNKTYREERSHIGEFTFTVVKYELFIKTNILSFTKKTLRSLWQLKKCNNSILNKNYLK
ncbi:unnamed protein product [Leptidea sinapis]|uniref:Myosin tail domain-containing protein n=1 Tax=Leptidea sinapis TaxID=189913 RepID=A0A5E4QDE9_9NEOP|nr:unnamed protein product [Leptidea sinapis]